MGCLPVRGNVVPVIVVGLNVLQLEVQCEFDVPIEERYVVARYSKTVVHKRGDSRVAPIGARHIVESRTGSRRSAACKRRIPSNHLVGIGWHLYLLNYIRAVRRLMYLLVTAYEMQGFVALRMSYKFGAHI